MPHAFGRQRAQAGGRVGARRGGVALVFQDLKIVAAGDLDDALRHAATLAELAEDDYGVLEVPKTKNAGEVLEDLFDDAPPPVVGRVRAALGFGGNTPAPLAMLPRTGPVANAVQGLMRELGALLRFDDPRGMYARLPYALQIP